MVNFSRKKLALAFVTTAFIAVLALICTVSAMLFMSSSGRSNTGKVDGEVAISRSAFDGFDIGSFSNDGNYKAALTTQSGSSYNTVGYATVEDAFSAVATNTETLITLLDDVALSGKLEIASSRKITLDLNGYVFDINARGVDKGQNYISASGYSSTFTITDRSNSTNVHSINGQTVYGGVITGGNINQGCIYVAGTSVILESGTIAGNTANFGGGVYVGSGTFTMNGGEICGNTVPTASDDLSSYSIYGGGGVYVGGGTFTMNGGKISNNTATTESDSVNLYGGGVSVYSGTFTMTGGEISGNTAPNGGGVYVSSIGDFYVSGSAVVYDNTLSDGTNSNVSLVSGAKIKVNGELTGDAKIGVTSSDEVFTSGYGTYNKPLPENFFVSDNGDYIVSTVSNYTIEATNGDERDAVAVQVDFDDYSFSFADIDSAWSYLIDNTTTSTITLLADVKSTAILTTNSANTYDITLDLCGKTFELKPTINNPQCGMLLYGGTKLTLDDTVGGGKITGFSTAYTHANGTITVGSGAEFVMQGGELSGNFSKYGGGVFVQGTFTMNGGVISGNSSSTGGGGVNVYTGGTFTMNGGVISENRAPYGDTPYGGGAVFVNENGTFTMNGGEITKNESAIGGAVHVYGGTFEICGNAKISDNIVYTTSDVDPDLRNVYLNSGSVINIIGELTAEDGPSIGVIMADGIGIFTSGYSNDNGDTAPSAYFFSDSGNYFAVLDGDSGEVKLSDGVASVTDSEGTTTNYLTIEDAWAAALRQSSMATPTTITLLDNVTVAEALPNIASLKSVTLDLNGHTLDLNGDASNIRAIVVSGSFTLTDNSVGGNGVLTGGYGSSGGAVSVGGTFNFEGGTISGNTAGGSGGGVYVNNAAFNMTGGTISNNTSKASTENYGGGGVYICGSTVNITGGKIINNTAENRGGGIDIFQSLSLTINNCEISGNTAKSGGGIYDDPGVITNSKITISDTTITNNTAQEYAGMYYSVGLSVSGKTVISGNKTADGADSNLSTGGNYIALSGALTDGASIGVSSRDSLTVFTNGYGTYNSAPPSTYFTSDNKAYTIVSSYVTTTKIIEAALGTQSDPSVRVEYVDGATPMTFEFESINQAMGFASNKTATVTLLADVTVSGAYIQLASSDKGNVTLDLNGKVLDLNGYYIMDGSSLTIKDSAPDSVTHNITVGDKTYTVSGGVITGGKYSMGGAINVGGSATLVLEGGTIIGNTATSTGGAVYIGSAGGSFTMNGGALIGNTATTNGSGGAIYMYAGTFTMNGGEISGNVATNYGGGVYSTSSGNIYINNSVKIYGNTLTSGDANNLNLVSGKYINIQGDISGSEIGVTIEKGVVGIFTNGYATNNSVDPYEYFSADTYGLCVGYSYASSKFEAAIGAAEEPVARVTYNGNEYDFATINYAFAYAAGKTATITLLADAANTENLVTITSGDITYDLNGKTHNLNGKSYINVDGSSAVLTIIDSSVNASGKITGGSNNNGGAVFVGGGTVNFRSGTISGNQAIGGGITSLGGGGGFIVNPGGILNMYGGVITDNQATISGDSRGGGGVFVNGGTFNMYGGEIYGNTAAGNGGGVYVYTNTGVFNMYGGTITDNYGTNGGGVYVFNATSTFTMTGGEISGNQATGATGKGGGVFMYNANGVFNLGGDAVIKNNTLADSTISNVNIAADKKINITCELVSGASIGITMAAGSGVFTTGYNAANGATAPSEFFVTDVFGNFIVLDGSGEVELSQGVASVTFGGNTTAYMTVDEAFVEANKIDGSGKDDLIEIKLLSGTTATATLSVTSGHYISLDLNGYVLRGTGKASVVTINKDSYFVLDDTRSAVSNEISFDNGLAADGKVTVSGGVITGGYDTNTTNGGDNGGGGGGIRSSGTFVMKGGNIIGNSANLIGGGVYVISGTFEMFGGNISYNMGGVTKNAGGGGVGVYSGSFTMYGGTITHNGLDSVSSGGGVSVAAGCTFTMQGGTISDNSAPIDGGGVSVAGTFTMTGGEISGNAAVQRGGGVYISGTINIGGSAVIENNTLSNKTTKNNVYLSTGKTINITAVLGDAHIGVTLLAGVGVVTSGYKDANGTTDPSGFFFSDLDYFAVLDENGEVKLTEGVASVTDSNGKVTKYATISAAVAYVNANAGTTSATGMTLTLLTNIDTASSVAFSSSTSSVRYVTLDLNGYVLRRTGTGRVVSVTRFNITVTDSNPDNVNNLGDGNGTFTYNGVAYKGGVITGGNLTTSETTSTTGSGGGILISTSSALTLKGGSIVGNSAVDFGGGIYVKQGSTCKIAGGVIADNTATRYGGGIYCYANLSMTAGKIINNTSGGAGSAIYLPKLNVLTISGGEISGNNSTSSTGYAIDTEGQGTSNTVIKLSGNPVIKDNTINGKTPANLHLNKLAESSNKPSYITIAGKLTDGADIHFTSYVYDNYGSSYAVFTIGYNANNAGVSPARYFTYDTANKSVYLNGDEAAIGEPVAQVTVAGGEPRLYGSVVEAFAEANAQVTTSSVVATIKLLKNVTAASTLTVNSGNYIELDLDGKTLTHSGDNNVITVNGSLKITGTGGVISGGKTGGVVINNGGVFDMSVGTITGNVGGGVVVNAGGRLCVSGSPIITGNTAAGGVAAQNVYLASGTVITVNGALGSDADIGITLANSKGVFTSGYGTEAFNNGNTPTDYFTADIDSNRVVMDGSEAAIIVTHTVNFYGEDSKLLDGPITVIDGEKVVFGGVQPTKENTDQYTYTFGWYEKDGDNYSVFNINSMSVTRDLELYARFEATVKNYNVSVDNLYDIGTVDGALKTVPYGTTITVNGNTLKFSYGSDTTVYTLSDGSQVLDGWVIDGELRENGYVYTVTGNTEITVVVRQKVLLKWTYLNEEVGTRVYSGASDRGNVKVVLTDINGNVLMNGDNPVGEFNGLSGNVGMTASNGKTVMQDVGVYTFKLTLGADFDKYIITDSQTQFVFEITPYIIDLSDENNYKWTLSGYGSELRDGTVYVYEVDGVMRYYYAAQTELGTPYAEIDVVRSIVRYRGDDVTLTIDLNNGAIPQLFVGGGNRTTVVYSGACSANDLGAYDAVATLTLNDSVNYKYIAGDINSKRGMTIDIRDNGATAVINKTWYVVTIRNGLLTPDDDEYIIPDFTFGDNIDVAAPVLEHGTLTDDNATFTLSYIGEDNKTVVIDTFAVSEFSDYINKSMPAGRYVLLISVDIVTDGEGIAYEAFTRTFDFTVAKADMSRFITDSAKGKTYVYGYTGVLQLHADGDLTVALPYVDGADRIGVWKNAKYDSFYTYELAYSMLRWDNQNYRTIAELNSQVTASQKPVNVGEYTVFYRITSNNFTTYGGDIADSREYWYKVNIAKAAYDTSDWGFDKDEYEFVYDGDTHSVTVKDNLPDGVKVTYTVVDENGMPVSTGALVNAGSYTITANIVGDENHEAIDFTCNATLVIVPMEINTADIAFADKSVAYDGNAHSLDGVTGLPDGVTVEYSRNSFTDVGRHEIVAYLTTDSNHTLVGDTELRVYLYILNVDLTVYVGSTDTVLVNVHNDKGFAYGTELVVTQLHDYTSDAIDGDILAAFDIKLVDADGNAVQPNGTITVRLLIPEGSRDLEDNELALLHVHDGSASKVTFTVDGDYAVFGTSSLSEFVFAKNVTVDPDVPVDPDNPDDPDDPNEPDVPDDPDDPVDPDVPVDPDDTDNNGDSDDPAEANGGNGKKNFFVRYWWLWLIILLLLILIIVIIIIVVNRRDDDDDETAAIAPVPESVVAPAVQASENVDETLAVEEEPTIEEPAPVEEEPINDNAEEEQAAAAAAALAAERQAEEEAATKAAEEEAARKAADDEAKKKERAAKAKATREANAAKRKAEQEAAAALAAERQAEEEAARKAAEEQAARKTAEEEAKKKERAAKAKATREANAAKRKAEQEAAAALAAERQAEDEAARKAAEEQAARKAAEEEAKKKERAAKAKATREANAAKRKAEEEARKAEEEAARKAAEEQAARKAAEEEAKKKERAAKAKAAREARAAAKAAERERIAAEEAKRLLADEQAAALIEEAEEASDRTRQCIVNIDMLSKYFADGETVTLNEIKKRVPKFDNRATYLKVLARGTLDKKLNIVADSFSLDAVKMIALTGGKAIRKGKK